MNSDLIGLVFDADGEEWRVTGNSPWSDGAYVDVESESGKTSCRVSSTLRRMVALTIPVLIDEALPPGVAELRFNDEPVARIINVDLMCVMPGGCGAGEGPCCQSTEGRALRGVE